MAVLIGAAGTNPGCHGNDSGPGQDGPPDHHVLNIGAAADALEVQNNTPRAPIDQQVARPRSARLGTPLVPRGVLCDWEWPRQVAFAG